MNGHFLWRNDAQADFVAPNFYNRDDNVIVDEDRLISFSRQDEHGLSPFSGGQVGRNTTCAEAGPERCGDVLGVPSANAAGYNRVSHIARPLYTLGMAIRIAINGFGRIGRPAFKVALEKDELEVVAINDLTETRTLAHLLRYDTIYGRYNKKVQTTPEGLVVDGRSVPVLAKKDPAELPWKALNVDVVLECTGYFTTREGAQAHVVAGAKRVVISAPSDSPSVDTILLGVNEDRLADQDIIANGSCTTNCVTPVAAILEEHVGIEKALMTTVHAITSTQNLIDAPSTDLRRARAAGYNIIPTTTGAAEATIRALPELKGKFDGLSVRVPIPTVSMADFTVVTRRETTREEVNSIFRQAADHPLYQGIVAVTDEPVVSSDFIGDPHSAIVDLGLTTVVGGNLVKVVAWYDNEWGYANRLVEQAMVIGKTLARAD